MFLSVFCIWVFDGVGMVTSGKQFLDVLQAYLTQNTNVHTKDYPLDVVFKFLMGVALTTDGKQ